ncbi:MAG: S8 family serine peptidase [Jaaginema sp. PMC 1079.18]|nr:S8 family serine peptidase [Jaaginema sp. PMC 1080.18]MEC4850002.1 S8 family serine peptidase [Jaaginema sp. PMC 1079.18]MEC4865925.1 S8 family serine peptidase [Jaaginema sp. PMC 1078.18]
MRAKLRFVNFCEAARRALTNSTEGHIVIQDATEGAKFESKMSWESNFNSGEYKGVKTVDMNPGSTFGVMLVPNGTVEQVANNPSIGGATRPLFSMETANPEDAFHVGQIADVTGDGNTFVMEDLRTDGFTDQDYNDIVFQVRGATAEASLIDDLIDADRDWTQGELGEAISAYTDPYLVPTEDTDIFDEDLSEDNYDITTELEDPDLEESSADDSDGEIATEAFIDELEAELFSEIAALENDPDAWGSDITAAETEFATVLSQLESDPDVTATIYEDAGTELDNQLAALETEIQEIANQQQAENGLSNAERDELYESLMSEVSSELDLPSANQPTIGILDTGFNLEDAEVTANPVALGSDFVAGDDNSLLAAGEGDNHGTKVLQTIAANNETAPLWLGRSVGSGKWAESLIEFVDAAQESGQPNAIVNLSFDLTETLPDGQIVVRDRLTPAEWDALEYARKHNVLVVAAAGNDNGKISALGQASRHFDNVLTVGAAEDWAKADYSSYGAGLDLLAPGSDGENAGTSLAAAQVTGAVSRVWAANPDLSYQQVIQLLKRTATDLDAPNWDAQTGAGVLNAAAAVSFASLITWPEIPGTTPNPEGLTAETTSINERPVFLRRTLKGLVNASNRVRRKVSQGFGSVTRSLARHSSKVRRTFSSNINRTRQRVTSNFNRLRQSASQRLRQWASKTINRARQTVRQGVSSANQLRQRIKTSFTNNIQRIRSSVSNWVARAKQGFRNTVSNIRNRVTNAVKRVWTPINQRISNARSRIVARVSSWTNYFKIGRESRSPRLFRAAYDRIKGGSNGLTPIGNAYRWGNGWTQKFWDKNGNEMLLMLEDGANEAFWVWHGNLAEYKIMGGAKGKLGYPRSNENVLSGKPAGSIWQAFAGYDGTSRIHYSPKTGSVATWGVIGRKYTALVGAYHWLGMPTRREYDGGNNTTFSDFEGGRIAFNRTNGATEVLRPGFHPSWVVKKILDRFPGLHFSTVVSVPTNKALDAGGNHHEVYPHSSPNAGNSFHQWGFHKVGDYYMLINKATGKALDAGGSNGKLPYAHPDPMTHNPYHLWKIQKDGSGYLIVNKATGRALDSGGAHGNQIYMYPHPISGNRYHQWKLNLPQATKPGYVNGNIGNLPLNFRSSPYVGNNKIGSLNQGTQLTILEKVTGGTYSGRNDWYKVKVGSQIGYVAAYYVSEGSGNNNGGGGNNTSHTPLLTTQGYQYFNTRSQFYGTNGNGYAKYGFGSSVMGTNKWREGNCTWYAYGRLKELGFNPDNVMSGYPNANQWGSVLSNGAKIVNSPQPGDVAQWTSGQYGHVAIVEKVENGYIWVSESHAFSDFDGDLDGDGLFKGDGTLHRIHKYTIGNPSRYIRLRK